MKIARILVAITCMTACQTDVVMRYPPFYPSGNTPEDALKYWNLQFACSMQIVRADADYLDQYGHLFAVERSDSDEPILVLPKGQRLDAEFSRLFLNAIQRLDNHQHHACVKWMAERSCAAAESRYNALQHMGELIRLLPQLAAKDTQPIGASGFTLRDVYRSSLSFYPANERDWTDGKLCW